MVETAQEVTVHAIQYIGDGPSTGPVLHVQRNGKTQYHGSDLIWAERIYRQLTGKSIPADVITEAQRYHEQSR